MSVHRFVEADAAKAAAACSRYILNCLEQALSGHDLATFAISGGNSPREVFRALAEAEFNWSRVHLFWVDERCVLPYNEQSNFRMADQCLVVPARIPRRNVHRVFTELIPDRAAERYAEDIRELLSLPQDRAPAFDLMHLGMGADGHTASLFPGDSLVQDRERITGATYVEKFNQWRVTMLPNLILGARHIVVFAPGADKAETTRAVFEDEFDPLRLPAQLPAHLGRNVGWFMDGGAASSLS